MAVSMIGMELLIKMKNVLAAIYSFQRK